MTLLADSLSAMSRVLQSRYCNVLAVIRSQILNGTTTSAQFKFYSLVPYCMWRLLMSILSIRRQTSTWSVHTTVADSTSIKKEEFIDDKDPSGLGQLAVSYDFVSLAILCS